MPTLLVTSSITWKIQGWQITTKSFLPVAHPARAFRTA
jgi:hypothetical protein